MDNMIKVEILSRELLINSYLKLTAESPSFTLPIPIFLNLIKTTTKNYCRILKKSLSDTLTDFYPIAGRFKDTSTIDCNDNGACVVEAKINSNLTDFLTRVNQTKDIHTLLGKLIPTLDSKTMELASKCMLIAQITVFNCGGVSISFCLEHRFCDFSSVMVFLNAGARQIQRRDGKNRAPDFVGSDFFRRKTCLLYHHTTIIIHLRIETQRGWSSNLQKSQI
ncbi:hypothetical protein G4B88_026221 [Cannabis sativa]|uniref:Uncharacterized protein n=1 Tax=Cannabis sativa TaxID=3483 RepID=A0A7J6EYB2_CANSA|nr:hypothetical protein G4B88_026221 [Cannabis sativa]